MDHTLILSDEDLTILNAAIQELPFKYAAPLVDKINTQLKAEQNKE